MKMHRLAIIFHKPSESYQDKLIEFLLPKKFKCSFLHISVAFDDDYYTWTCRGLEVLDINQAVMQTIHWIYVDTLEPYQIRAFDMCEQKITLWSLLLAKFGWKANTCASLVSRVVWDEYLAYPSQVMGREEEEGVWF